MLLAGLGSFVVFAQTITNYGSKPDPVYNTGALVGLAVITCAWIYCGYRCVANGHMLLFVLGFCFPVLWIIGAFMGKKYDY